MDALWWHQLDEERIACDLCPVACHLRPGQDGSCSTRGNRGGRMVALNYGQVVALGIDPIEKKPLYHFWPGSTIFSAAAAGCNLHCQFCQNAEISQGQPSRVREMTPGDLVAAAAGEGSRAIAYTYSEPLVWYEFVRDAAAEARETGMANVIVSNGYLNPEPLADLAPLLDAANIDLKAMDDDFYQKICRARLQPVLESIAALHAAGVHLEITNLVIPGRNDTDQHFRDLAAFIAGVDPRIPLHLSAYHPSYRCEAPATPVQTLIRAAEFCAGVLDHVYVGNVTLPGWSDTRCRGCGEVVISRRGYRVEVHLTAAAACSHCGRPVPVRLDPRQTLEPPIA